MKDNYEVGEVLQKRIQLSKEINSFPVIIDRAVFKKTPQEKEELKLAKSAWKKSQMVKVN